MSWLWVIQAFLIAVLFLTGNYYLWVGWAAFPASASALHQVLLAVLVLGRSCGHAAHDDRRLARARGDGGSHHPFSCAGVMSAKNTAVNLMILTTFLSFLLYRRATSGRRALARTGT